ncbi:MAG: 16S rRNA (guanine(527)-N(7))-methyltransferase RsmG [Polynucleobacter sp. 24-46-87]|jgi:16S rRNA (guanine527-N7)-methyltransferase|uniref:16S rRNA (guanine(527)-N(7))-methyltransferase RsmG n=1 Tax=unclassified Polynucleobacter TaxID=2640945 RepID=UPI000BC91A86|nr:MULTISPECIES: 16S rRNA (guanine(527)-N(7))-methyltransferase RsmG [unclassified Polynucleobacter]OYY14416.1 MAG: 16S rRNA (guanine(527)-N(7))-methyltransferase RsmG [Polynucleobacter sp. 35-46-11]OZA11978.1 MAG: 16S rRNA (guanine(527)-N(7))-methyltransferase RsmG [Polynucleobacter sp. 24-46-87]OZA74568.1 MAG: 16S rRNA (guanine(527)-N(7))-methyltransferase RsmG [Polynucleobacter sp. 39-46-10]
MSNDLVSLGIEDLGLNLSPAKIDDLELFLQEMGRWNQVHNLTAIEGEKNSVRLHLIDSITVLPIMRQFLDQENPKIADLGSGGGLPAIPIAILQSGWHVTLIEAIRKKTAFLQHVRGKLGLKNIEVLSERVEMVAKSQPGQFDAVISRAFTNLAHFLELALPLLKPNGLVFAMKAKRADEELQDVCMDDWRLVADEPLQIPNLAVERRLLVLSPVRKSHL